MYKQFDQDFRDNAVRLALEKKIKLNDLAKDLGIGRSTLNKPDIPFGDTGEYGLILTLSTK
jgi:transposase-like protein